MQDGMSPKSSARQKGRTKRNSQRVSGGHADKLAKRVLAPYVSILRRGRRITLRRAADFYTFFLSKKSSVLMKNLITFMANKNDLPGLIHEAADVLKGLTNSLGVRLYIYDKSTDQIYHFQKNVPYPRCRVNYNIDLNRSVAAYVASTKEYVMIEDITQDAKFPDGVNYKDNVKSVLAVPILADVKLYAVLEFYRDMSQEPYGKNDLKMVVLVTSWIGLTLSQTYEGVMLHKKQELNDDLLNMVLGYYGNIYSIESLLAEFINYTKKQLNAEKGAFYVITGEEDNEYLADVYEEGITDVNNSLIKKKLKVKFGKERNVPSYVAHHLELVNVKDVYNDPRFTKQITKDADLNVIHRSELCIPVLGNQSKLLGVMSIMNKRSGYFFTDEDETLIRLVGTYCCMALHYSNALKLSDHSELKLKSCVELLKYHLKPCDHQVKEFDEEYVLPKNIREYSWYIMPDDMMLMPQLYVYMCREVFGEAYINFEPLKLFTLTVQKSYRSNPYHNFEHAFNVAHCMHIILSTNRDKFTLLEMEALMVAALLHDVDHAGVTNNHLLLTDHYLVQLYEESTWENHHFYVATIILSVYDIFKNINNKNYHEFLNQIKHNILTTDLFYFFKFRNKILPVILEKQFSWNNTRHKSLGRAIIMTVCDLSGQCKPFSISKKITDRLYEEFYSQGDKEKELGFIPLTMMDRESQAEVPDDQEHFLTIVVMCATEVLREILPNTEQIYQNAEMLRDTWAKIIESRGAKLWRQCDSIVQYNF